MMAVALYLITSERVPDLGEGIELLMVQGEGAPCPPDELDVLGGRHGCVTTLVANSCDLDSLMRSVSAWWRELSGVEPTVELLATDLRLMSSHQRESVGKLEPETWSVRTPLAVFSKNSAEAAAEARALVTETALETN